MSAIARWCLGAYAVLLLALAALSWPAAIGVAVPVVLVCGARELRRWRAR